jgi:protein O-GlcNAc transferase
VCSLDTFPYAGTTTTCESLYMGVPCVTMAGLVHAHNVGVTLLHQVGTFLNLKKFDWPML